MEGVFKDKGLRATQFRKTIYRIFEKNKTAISPKLIEDELEDFDRITLYRTLKLFKEKGVIHEIVFPNQEKKLALCHDECKEVDDVHNHDHIHFRCSQCEEIFCVDIPSFPELNLKGYNIDRLDIQAVGTCVRCSE